MLANSPSMLHLAPSRRPGKQFTADQHATDFASARPNRMELGVAPQAPRRILVDIAVATQCLDRLAGHPSRLLGGVEDCAGANRAYDDVIQVTAPLDQRKRKAA
jgi:hypothetical protein